MPLASGRRRRANDLEIFGGDYAAESARLYGAARRTDAPPAGAFVFYDSTGELVRLFDSDSDGMLDDRRALISDLPGSLVAVARHGDIVIATSAQGGNEQIMFFRRGEHWRDPLTPLTAIRLRFRNAMHQSYALATRPNPDNPDAFDLVHPRCVEETELDYAEGIELWKAGEPEEARDALRFALEGCHDNLWVHVALGRIALQEFKDPNLARGHFGYAVELVRILLESRG